MARQCYARGSARDRLAPVLCLALLCAVSCRRPAPAPPAIGAATAAARPSAGAAAPPPGPGPSARAPARRLPARQARPPALAVGTRGAVASAEQSASEIGLAVLKRGGGAVDAAVAVAFALAVTHPAAGNIGGGGFMIVRTARGEIATIDYREKAPLAAGRDMYLDARGNPTQDSLLGARAAAIPGTVAGLGLAHRRFGSLSWKELVLPAVGLARAGHRLDRWHAADLARAASRARAAGLAASAAYFERPDGGTYGEGDLFVQPELAATLAAIAERGPEAFYRGPLGERLVRGVREAGGIWQERDLAQYQAIERAPVVFAYRGHRIATMPPPSAGGVVLAQILTASEQLGLASKPGHSPDEVHLYLEAARRAYADRNGLLGDPDFLSIPLARLLDPAYVAQRIASIDPRHATDSTELGAGLPAPAARRRSEQTTHFSVVDEAGAAVANTYTLNTSFGSGFVVPGLGVLLNNEMDDFSVKPGSPNAYGLVQSEPNRIEPAKRMLSSMTPTIVLKDGELRAVIGTPGGPTITTTVAQIVRALIDYGRPIEEAVAAPRIHHQWLPDVVSVEGGVAPELESALRARGHRIERRASMGHADCIEIDPATGGLVAVADVARGGGAAVAY
ncbi:MAG: gamma-glutamyltransferase [Deltaproteobacteria bacterium]|nr:gamma-glutamyltransferase [Deltaproteobacteria bacterium]